MDDALEVHGYRECPCGEWMPHTETTPAPALCPTCRREAGELIDEGRLRYEVGGRTFTTRPPPKPRKTKPRKLTGEQHERRKAWERARMRTLVRLSEIYRPMYELILAEEKLREGLDPTIHQYAPRPKAIASTLLADLDEAAERAERGR